ncbi:MAG: tartrate dehydrogenase [Planctomycetes bacterium]|nr:tartrate dehydrogenase [Planctomycetota bacterium]
MRSIHLKLIPGDGIGIEVIREGKRVLERIAEAHGGLRFEIQQFDWGCQYYLKHGRMMPEDALGILADCDSIVLGAVGFPGVPDHISLRGLLLPIRFEFDQYINFRPVKFLEGLESPLKAASPESIDFVVFRENTEGEYCGKGYRRNEGSADELVVQEAWFSRKGTERVIRAAFEYAVEHGLNSVVSATKSNALNYSMVFWDEIFALVQTEYPQIATRSFLIDALSALFILKPEMFEVVVASNLFGDILTDLGSAMVGSIGVAPSANLNPEKKYPSMFEPVHGSAPDIAGKGIANPIGTLWSLVLMLEHLNLKEMSDLLMQAIAATIRSKKLTPDLGGNCSTSDVVDDIIDRLPE